jgi:glycosyltransferase involved in cell wall biosynthesis
MRFVMVSQHYPAPGDPIFVFSQQITEAMAGYHGVESVVISPQSITRKLVYHKKISKFIEKKKMPNGTVITLYRYPYFTFSESGNKILARFSDKSRRRALKKCIKKANLTKDDYCYSMFWQRSKFFDETLSEMDVATNIIVESSESELQDGEDVENYDFKNLKAIVCVSSEKVNECNKYHLLNKAQHVVIPNGFDSKLFKKSDRHQMREKYGFDQDAFIIAFVGSFTERKGVPQLNSVLKKIDGVHSIFIGAGEIEPDCPNLLFKGSLDHDRIPEYLACADVFVLPTKHEGCANVLVEALGCGLPIISSDRDFNKEILDSNCAVLINPESEDELLAAIEKLRDNKELRAQMEQASLEKAKGLTIENRTKKILDLIDNYLEA